VTAHTSPALRLKQGVRALAAFARPVEMERAAALLTPEALDVFRRMARSEQLHSLAVLQSAHAEDYPVLAQAALLHDAGKSLYPVSLWQRTLPVLVGAVSPSWVTRLSRRDPRAWWSRGFVVYARHPEWSAELAAAAGAPEDVVWLVRHHADDPAQWRAHPLYPLLLRLQAADDAN
jgi:hypothetical protein